MSDEADETPPAWRHAHTEGLPAASKVSPTRRVIVGLLLFLGFGLFTYGTALWLRPLPRPTLFVWGPTEYAQLPFGSVPFAVQDRTGFDEAGWFTIKPLQLPLFAEAGAHETIVVRLTGRAMCDAEGRVQLLADDAEPASSKGSLPLRKVLIALADSPARHKFLLIDLFWPSEDPYLTDLARDLPRRIVDELNAVPDDGRLSLLSCQSGQTPIVSPDLGRSLFGHYVDDGLRGWADSDDAPRDDRGQVTARRLARFVQHRVERWAEANRGVRQTPLLVGEAPDFALVAVPKGMPRERRSLETAVAYPKWLIAGWKVRDQWQAEDRDRVAAWLSRQLDHVLLQAERDWANGGDETRTQATLRLELDRLQRTYAPLAAASVPEPTTLAAMNQSPDAPTTSTLRSTGSPGDPALVKAVQGLVKKIDDATRKGPKAEDIDKSVAKLLEEFLPTLEKQSDTELAAALFAAAVQDPFPRRSTIELFDRLLIERMPEPEFEETVTLHRLAKLAATTAEAQWPVRLVRKSLELTRRATTANSRPDSSAWLREAVESAAQKRHDAEVLFFSRGYAPLTEAETRLDDALTAYALLLSRQEILERGQRTLDEAMAVLPWHARALNALSGDDQVWRHATRLADELAVVLWPDDRAAKPRLEEIELRSQELRTRLDLLHQPFSSEAIKNLIQQAKSPDGSAAEYRALESRLLIPMIPAETRAEIWAACRELGGKLAAKSAERDEEDALTAPEVTTRVGDAARFLRQDGERVPARVQQSLDLLRLAGTRVNQLETLRESAAEILPVETSVDPPTRIHNLEERLRQTWTLFLPIQWAEETKPGRRERLARVWPGWLRPAGQSQSLVDATSVPRRKSRVEQWGWLGDLYRFLSRDPEAPSFYSRAAFAMRDFTPPPGPYVAFPETSTSLDITLAKPRLTTAIPIRFVGGPFPGAVAASIIQADDQWLRTSHDPSQLEPPNAKKVADPVVPLNVTATLLPGAELSIAPRPLGFLVSLGVGGRTTYHRVGLPFLPDPERVELILTSNPQQPNSPFGDLRLRPSKGPQAFFVFVRNGGDKSRTLLAELRVKDELIPGGAITVTVGPRQTARLPFPGLVKKVNPDDKDAAPIELPTLDSPLQLRVVDKESNEVLAKREVKVSQASPREYVRVPTIRFEPASGDKKNRLELIARAGNSFTGPPCVVELVLPKNRIPGLRTVRDGVFRGELTEPGQEIKLYAADIDFDPGADEEGVAYLTIDGVPRAIVFRVTYARFGEPTTPREDDRPSLRINSERYFRTGSQWEGTIETDNAPGSAKLELSLGRYGADGFEAEMKHTPMPARQKGIGFGIRPEDGALVFEPFTRDWKATFDSVPVRGERLIHARLVGDKDQDIVPRVDHVVVFDDQVPERIQFVDLPKQARAGQPLLLQATGIDRGAGIRDVTFFLGALSDDKKIPTGAVKAVGEQSMEKRDIWTGSLAMPADKKGPVEVGVLFVNRVGMSALARGTIEMVEFDPAKTAPAVIVGTVYEGEITQKGLTVQLLDAKGNKLAETKTDRNGAFTFERVPPGPYVLVSEKPAAGARRRAVVNVTVNPAKTERVRLNLTL